MKIRLLLAAVTLGAAATAHGEPVTVAEPWTASTLGKMLAAMPGGDAARGKALHHDLFCASCHGAEGVAPTRNWPSLAGQRAAYTFKVMVDYRDRRRHEDGRADPMTALAHGMSDQQIADVAAYYASLPSTVRNPEKPAEETLRLIRRGDPTRLLSPCASCHGLNGQGGKNETPALAGQRYEYLMRTMEAYRDGRRANDSHHGMGQFAMPLTDSEIAALAKFYAR